MQEAHCIEPIGALELYRAGAGLLCAGVEAAFVGLEMLLEVYFKVIFVAHGEHAVLFLLGGDGGGHGFADAADGYVRMQREGARAGAFVYGNGGNVRVYLIHPFAKAAVAAYAVYGHAEELAMRN